MLFWYHVLSFQLSSKSFKCSIDLFWEDLFNRKGVQIESEVAESYPRGAGSELQAWRWTAHPEIQAPWLQNEWRWLRKEAEPFSSHSFDACSTATGRQHHSGLSQHISSTSNLINVWCFCRIVLIKSIAWVKCISYRHVSSMEKHHMICFKWDFPFDWANEDCSEGKAHEDAPEPPSYGQRGLGDWLPDISEAGL